MECHEIKQKIIILILLFSLFAASAGAIIYSNYYWKKQDTVTEKHIDFGKEKCYEVTILEYEDLYEELKEYQSVYVKGIVKSEDIGNPIRLTIVDEKNDREIIVYGTNGRRFDIGDVVYIYADLDSYSIHEPSGYKLVTGDYGETCIVSPDGYIEKEPVEGDEYMSVDECIARGDDIFKKISFKITGTIKTKNVQNNIEYYLYDDEGNNLEINPIDGEVFEDGEKVTIVGKLAKYPSSLVMVQHAD